MRSLIAFSFLPRVWRYKHQQRPLFLENYVFLPDFFRRFSSNWGQLRFQFCDFLLCFQVKKNSIKRYALLETSNQPSRPSNIADAGSSAESWTRPVSPTRNQKKQLRQNDMILSINTNTVHIIQLNQVTEPVFRAYLFHKTLFRVRMKLFWHELLKGEQVHSNN